VSGELFSEINFISMECTIQEYIEESGANVVNAENGIDDQQTLS
jgi:hypothetical protein